MEVFDIKKRIDSAIVKKIFGKEKNAKDFLIQIGINTPKNLKAQDIYNLIVKKWDYEIALPIIRSLFKKTRKFQRGFQAETTIEILLDEWEKLGLGKIDWPFSQSALITLCKE